MSAIEKLAEALKIVANGCYLTLGQHDAQAIVDLANEAIDAERGRALVIATEIAQAFRHGGYVPNEKFSELADLLLGAPDEPAP